VGCGISDAQDSQRFKQEEMSKVPEQEYDWKEHFKSDLKKLRPKGESYLVTFNFIKDLEKSIMVRKKTKKISKLFFVPKSIIIAEHRYEASKSFFGDSYQQKRIAIELPNWYCEKQLGFYK
jgi:hypothetical protein